MTLARPPITHEVSDYIEASGAQRCIWCGKNMLDHGDPTIVVASNGSVEQWHGSAAWPSGYVTEFENGVMTGGEYLINSVPVNGVPCTSLAAEGQS